MNYSKVLFLREFFREFTATGSFWPSSERAAAELARPLRSKPREQRKILEVGAGTGAVTKKILDEMITGDELTICEINPRFMTRLKKDVRTSKHYRWHRDQIRFFQGPVQELPTDENYDIICCGIPFLNLERTVVEEIFETFLTLSSSATSLTFYEYIGMRSLSRNFGARKRRTRMRQLDIFFERLSQRFNVEVTREWFNILPIKVYHVTLVNEAIATPPEPELSSPQVANW